MRGIGEGYRLQFNTSLPRHPELLPPQHAPQSPHGAVCCCTQARTDYSYNEVIVRALYWEERGPRAIEAVMFNRPGGEAQARKFHEAFLATFSLTAAEVPLLRYTGGRGQPLKGFQDVS